MGLEKRITHLACNLVARYYMKRPGMGDFLHTKFFTYSGVLSAVRNELSFRAGSLNIPGIGMIAMELTNACNLKCAVCPVNSVMERPRGFMDLDMYRRVLEVNEGVQIVQLCLWGEPLMHPKLLDFIRIADGLGIRSYLYTNGTLLNDDLAGRLLDSGLHRILFSLDGYGDTYMRIRDHEYGDVEAKIFRFLHLREKRGSDIRVGVAMVACEDTAGLVPGFRERWQYVADEIQITPHITHEKSSRSGHCRLLWLGYPIVLWNGTVVPCCVDYEGTLSMGNVREEADLEVIWNGPRAVELRKEHLDMRFRGVCGRCHEYRTDDIRPRFDR